MNAVEIEEAVAKLVSEPFDPESFPYALLEAFGNKSATIAKLKSGTSNGSDIPGAAPAQQHSSRSLLTGRNDADARGAKGESGDAKSQGVPTGEESDFDVLDIDVRNGGLGWYETNKKRLPATRLHRTRSGSLHLLFKHSPSLKCGAGNIAPGVDIRRGCRAREAVSAGTVTQSLAERLLLEAACQSELPKFEAIRTIRSAFTSKRPARTDQSEHSIRSRRLR